MPARRPERAVTCRWPISRAPYRAGASAVCLVLLLFAGNADAAAQVRAVRVGLKMDHVRLVLESNGPIQARIALPTQPGSLIIDLDGVDLNAVLGQLPAMVGANDPYLSSVRFSRGESGIVHMELISPLAVTPQIFNLKPGDGHGNRLVMDIYPDQFAAIPSPPPPASTRTSAATAVPQETAEATVTAMQPVPPVQPAPAPDTGSLLHSPNANAAISASALQESWLEVHVNQDSVGTALILQDAAHHVLVRAEDLEQWRIRVTGAVGVLHEAATYFPLDAIKGLSYRIDASTESLLLDVPPSLFDTTQLSGRNRGLLEPTPSPPGAYVNYDVFANRAQRGPINGSAFVETGVFGRWGSASSTLLARHLQGGNQFVRLDTAWVRDEPDKMATLRFGDAISGTSSWGRSVRFGGVQWATDFATQPTFVTIPMPTLSGTATTPSTVDFYVNNVKRLQRTVPSGPFSIQDLPVITGQGQIRLVVRDLLGREQTISQPFYATGGLLAQGLRDFSYEVGFERQNYSLASNDYGRFVAVGTERRGLSDTLTGELHAELLRRQQTAGIGATVLLSTAGVLTASVAASHDGAGAGGLLSIGFQHQSGHLGYGARTQFTSPRFVQLGYESPAAPPRQTTTAYMSLGTLDLGSVGLSYTYEDFRDRGREDVALVGGNYNLSLSRLGYLSFSVLRILSGKTDTLYGLNFTRALGERTTASFNGQAQAGSRQGTLQLQQGLPVGSGIGYRLQTGLAASDPRRAGISLQNAVGTYDLDVGESQNQLGYQASARGSIAMLGGKVYFSRDINDSFAVVQVPGYANVRVYADNQQVARTDSNGFALVPQLRPYQKNPIRIEQADLPLDAQIDGLQLDAVPYLHGALALRFPVTRSHGALLAIKLGDGSFLPAGAEVAVQGNPNAFPVGMRGEVYLTGLTQTNRLHVTWQGQSCELVVPFPQTADPLPNLGTVTCTGIRP